MEYNTFLAITGKVLNHAIKYAPAQKKKKAAIYQEYKTILSRASDIGAHNMLLSSYALAAYFIAMCRHTGLTPEDNYQLMEKMISTSSLPKLLLGNSEQYFSDKKMEQRRVWSKETHQHRYQNDWVVDVLEGSGDYDFGLDYTECGVCKLCRDEGCFELAHYLCKLDFLLVEVVGAKLVRTETLADGGDKCDFRFYKNK